MTDAHTPPSCAPHDGIISAHLVPAIDAPLQVLDLVVPHLSNGLVAGLQGAAGLALRKVHTRLHGATSLGWGWACGSREGLGE